MSLVIATSPGWPSAQMRVAMVPQAPPAAPQSGPPAALPAARTEWGGAVRAPDPSVAPARTDLTPRAMTDRPPDAPTGPPPAFLMNLLDIPPKDRRRTGPEAGAAAEPASGTDPGRAVPDGPFPDSAAADERPAKPPALAGPGAGAPAQDAAMPGTARGVTGSDAAPPWPVPRGAATPTMPAAEPSGQASGAFAAAAEARQATTDAQPERGTS